MSGCPLGSWIFGATSRGASAHALAPTKVAWNIQREIVLLLAWGPAVLLQLAHPLIARGVEDHTDFGVERWGRVTRFNRTLDAMLRLCFGTETEALATVARINTIHNRVHGRLDETAGIFPAGTAYSAHDPALLAWVHATLVAMNLRVYELYVGGLSLEEKDRYCDEASTIESPFNIPAGTLPRSSGALDHYLDATLRSGAIVVTDTARRLARAIVHAPLMRIAGPAALVMRLPTIGFLPASIRDAYGFRWRPRDDALLRHSAGLIRRIVRLTPPALRHWPAARTAASRR